MDGTSSFFKLERTPLCFRAHPESAKDTTKVPTESLASCQSGADWLLVCRATPQAWKFIVRITANFEAPILFVKNAS
jgi:hypothetical protein